MSEMDKILRQAMADNAAEIADFARTAEAIGWIQHLATAAAWETAWPQAREPLRESMLGHVDLLLSQARSGKRFSGSATEWMLVDGCDARLSLLRSLLEGWSPPALTEEIAQAARDLLNAGQRES